MRKINEIFIIEFMWIIEWADLNNYKDYKECKDRIQSYLWQYDYLIRKEELTILNMTKN